MAVIEVSNLSKRFRVPHVRVYSLKQAFVQRLRQSMTYEELWALRDVSFSLEPGAVVGLVGANGSGKSTLLSILAHVLRPTSGSVRVEGTICALLELGVGFNPELTGTENVYLNAALLGMPRRETAQRYESIVDFAEIRDFMDAPVKTYSSGMRVRLAFSVALHVDPDIYLLDEVLAVGDAHFAQKSGAKIEELSRSGKTIIVASHNLAAVESLCTSAIWLDHGRVMKAGDPRETVKVYQEASAAGA